MIHIFMVKPPSPQPAEFGLNKYYLPQRDDIYLPGSTLCQLLQHSEQGAEVVTQQCIIVAIQLTT
jgi:hypothetical protein